MKVQEDLDRLREDKSELEAELKARNEEIYQLNEKLMMLEINQQMNGQPIEAKAVAELQAKLDKVFDINARRVNDMLRLRQFLERLRFDIQMLSLNRKQGKLLGV